MKSIKSVPFVWLPLLTIWTIILVLFKNFSITDIELYIPLVAYLPVSFIFSTQYGLLLKDQKEYFFTKLSSSTSIIICFLISTISIFAYMNGTLWIPILKVGIDFDLQKSLFFIVFPLVANLIINEFMSISNKKLVARKKRWDNKNLEIEEQQVQRSKGNAISRENSLIYREKWKSFLKKSLTEYSEEKNILIEIERLLSIVEFSSYFRDELSMEELKEIKISKDKLHIKNILKNIK